MSEGVTKTEYRYITRNEKIQGGEPVLKGTRFPVRSVVFYTVKEGMLPEELVKEFPQAEPRRNLRSPVLLLR